MYGSRSQRGSSRRGGRNSTKVSLKGLFSDGVWKCNCDPRLPTQHFQTKNGGKNHGRWFYTCQLPQPKRCDFFLWDDEAKGREAAAVLNNSRTEPGLPAPVTPRKEFGVAATGTGLATPETGGRYKRWGREEGEKPIPTPTIFKRNGDWKGGYETRQKSETQATAATTDASDDEFYDWPASDEAELEKVADEASGNKSSAPTNAPLSPETPRKALKTEILTSPGKRHIDDVNAADGGKAYLIPATRLDEDDVFAVSSARIQPGNGLFSTKPPSFTSASDTPTPIRYRDVPLGSDSELGSEILSTLAAHAVALPAEAKEAVKNICNRHVLYTRGIMKGRDVSRSMVKSKDGKLVEMRVEIEGLKNERETDHAVIRHLRREMAQRKETAV